MTQIGSKRNRLTPWYIGVPIVLGAVAFIGHRMWSESCQAPLFVELIVLAIIPLVYLTLMYLTFVSQE